MFRSQLERMPFAMEQDEAPDSGDISPFREMTVVTGPKLCADALHEARTFHVAFAFFLYPEYTTTRAKILVASNASISRYTTDSPPRNATFLSYTSKLGDTHAATASFARRSACLR
jgi:hypothetical protein